MKIKKRTIQIEKLNEIFWQSTEVRPWCLVNIQ